MATTQKLTTQDVRNALGENVTLSRGVFTLREGFFYTHGRTAGTLVRRVLAAFPKADVLDSGEVWKAFNGGAPLAKSSHWFVKFTL